METRKTDHKVTHCDSVATHRGRTTLWLVGAIAPPMFLQIFLTYAFLQLFKNI
jgi:hypothetical protein